MPNKIRIALDAMGGDHGPEVVMPGAAMAHQRHPDTEFLFFGDTARIEAAMAGVPALKPVSQIIHTDVAIRMDDKPSQALRQGRLKSSMWQAIDAVKQGRADVAVSAGNTGALMAMATVHLRTMAGIDRPAIAAIWPTLRGESVVLDLGATIGADTQHLVDMALMGSAMARILLGIERPTVGLLNIGVEEVKGLDEVREASQILRERNLPHINYAGFVEGDDIGKGTVDVVVTEGFAGNIALKSAEGTARQLAGFLRTEMKRTIWTKIGYLFAKQAFQALRDKLDPDRSNGGVFLGLNGIVIKSHGGASASGFSAAVDIGYQMVRNELMEKIGQALVPEARVVAQLPSETSAAGAAS